MKYRLEYLAIAVAWLVSVTVSAAEGPPSGYIQLDETVIAGNQELPKVLYIVPWRDPKGLPEIDMDPEFTELEVFRRLYPPAYRRELDYHETLTAVETEE